jgi:hypothetical protein
MDIIWNFVVVLVITWLVLKLIAGYLHAKNAQLKDQLNELDKKVKELFVRVSIEKHGEVYYIFEKETDRFVAQGKTADEIKEIMQQRFPNKTFIATDEEIKSSGLTL